MSIISVSRLFLPMLQLASPQATIGLLGDRCELGYISMDMLRYWSAKARAPSIAGQSSACTSDSEIGRAHV